jgi:hypothetical protein
MPVTRTSGQGRPKGVLNKRTRDVIDKLAALDCDPIEGMALIAMDERNSIEVRARMFVELAQYVAPKRKAVEHSGDGATLEALLLKLDAEHVDGAAALRGSPGKRAMIPPTDAMTSGTATVVKAARTRFAAGG